ncbi:hypothetical protein Afe04nite_80050 [Asanoa ferruginea]|nr:hypothetical protein Afe04nite_80050 [Asanoa ferruginea]
MTTHRRLTTISSVSVALAGLIAGAVLGAVADDLAGGSLGIASTTAIAAALAIGVFAAVMQLLVRAFERHASVIERTVEASADQHSRAIDSANSSTGRATTQRPQWTIRSWPASSRPWPRRSSRNRTWPTTASSS